MEENKRIKQILQQYYEFCLSLLNKIPAESGEKQMIAEQVYQFRSQLTVEISRVKNEQNYYNTILQELRAAIEKQQKK